MKTETTKHTPGPWDYRDGFALTVGESHDPEGKSIATISGPPGDAFANARLIAAAPELLAACEAVATCLGKLPIGDPLIGEAHTACKKARAAIAKATG